MREEWPDRGVLNVDPASGQGHSGQSRAGSPGAERYAGLIMGFSVPSCFCKWPGAKGGVSLRVHLPFRSPDGRCPGMEEKGTRAENGVLV